MIIALGNKDSGEQGQVHGFSHAEQLFEWMETHDWNHYSIYVAVPVTVARPDRQTPDALRAKLQAYDKDMKVF